MERPDYYNNYLQSRLQLLDRLNHEDFLRRIRQTDPCENCNNNPINNTFASGICDCMLPALYNPIT